MSTFRIEIYKHECHHFGLRTYYCLFLPLSFQTDRLFPLDCLFLRFSFERLATACSHHFQRSLGPPFFCRCVAKFDHFCPFVGNSIGALNHGWFIGFLFFAGVCVFQGQGEKCVEGSGCNNMNIPPAYTCNFELLASSVLCFLLLACCLPAISTSYYLFMAIPLLKDDRCVSRVGYIYIFHVSYPKENACVCVCVYSWGKELNSIV